MRITAVTLALSAALACAACGSDASGGRSVTATPPEPVELPGSVGYLGPSFDGTDVWFTSDAGVIRVDESSGDVRAVIDEPVFGQVVFTDGFAWSYSSARGETNFLAQIDTATNEVVGRPQICASRPGDLIIVGQQVWTSCLSDIIRVDALSGQPIDVLEPGVGLIEHMAEAEGSVWITTSFDAVVRLEPDSGDVMARIDVGEQPWFPVVAGGSLWVANALSGTVSRIDMASNTVIATVITGEVPFEPVADDEALWVPNRNDDSVSRIDLDTNEVTTFAFEDSDDNLAVTGLGVWVPQHYGRSITRIDAETGETLDVFSVGDEPRIASFEGAEHLWIVNQEEGTVERTRVVP